MKYIIYTKKGNKEELPDLFAFNEGIFVFEFYGDTTYTDPFDSSVWNWVGYNNGLEEILVVVYNGQFLVRTISLTDCRTQDGSFFWDDTNGILYIHWFNFADDFYFDKSLTTASEVGPGFANGYSSTTNNVFDSIYYSSIISDLNGFTKKADLTKLGLVTFEESTFSLTDQENLRYEESSLDTVGLPLWVYLATDQDENLTDDLRIFTGIYNGYKHNRESIQYNIIEQRLFDNKPVCPNTISSVDYPNVGDLEGEFIPVAWGQIRRGITLLTNKDSLTTGSSGTAVFLVSDPNLGSMTAISNIYDASDISQTITATNLSACTVDVTKPAGVSVGDLKDWTFEGQGYAISGGTYNNGLDIIKTAYFVYANINYISSTFDLVKWNTETTINTQSVGLSIQSEKGFIEEIIEPITTSLQGIVETTGSGKITWSKRDTSQKAIIEIPIVKAKKELELPPIELTSKEVVSEVQVNYSRNFETDESLKYLYNIERTEVIVNYLIDKRQPLSPVESVLYNESDAQSLAIELMETSNAPIINITTESTDLLINTRFFEIIGIDIGLFDNENIIYGELLTIDPNFNEFTQNISIRVIENYQPFLYQQGNGFIDQEIDYLSTGFTDLESDYVSDGFSITRYI